MIIIRLLNDPMKNLDKENTVDLDNRNRVSGKSLEVENGWNKGRPLDI